MTTALLVGAIPSPPENAIGIGPRQLRADGLAIAVGVLVATPARDDEPYVTAS